MADAGPAWTPAQTVTSTSSREQSPNCFRVNTWTLHVWKMPASIQLIFTSLGSLSAVRTHCVRTLTREQSRVNADFAFYVFLRFSTQSRTLEGSNLPITMGKFLEAVKIIDNRRVILCHHYREILSAVAYNLTFSANSLIFSKCP